MNKNLIAMAAAAAVAASVALSPSALAEPDGEGIPPGVPHLS